MADARCLNFVAIGTWSGGGAQALVSKLVAERTLRQEYLGEYLGKPPQELKRACEYYIDFGGQSDGAGLRRRLGRAQRQRALDARCRQEQIPLHIATVACKEYLDQGSQSLLDSSLARLKAAKEERQFFLKSELGKILNSEFVSKILDSKFADVGADGFWSSWEIGGAKNDFVLHGRGSAAEVASAIASLVRKDWLRKALGQIFIKDWDSECWHKWLRESVITADVRCISFIANAEEPSTAQVIANEIQADRRTRQLNVLRAANIDNFTCCRRLPHHVQSCTEYVDFGRGTVEVASCDLGQAVRKHQILTMLKQEIEPRGFPPGILRPTPEDLMKSLLESDARYESFLYGRSGTVLLDELSAELRSESCVRCDALQAAYSAVGIEFRQGDKAYEAVRRWLVLGVGNPVEIAGARLREERVNALGRELHEQHLPELSYFTDMFGMMRRKNLMINVLVDRLARNSRLPPTVACCIGSFLLFAVDCQLERFATGEDSDTGAPSIAAGIAAKFKERYGQLASHLDHDLLPVLDEKRYSPFTSLRPLSCCQVVKNFCYVGYAKSFSCVVEAAKRLLRKEKLEQACSDKDCSWILHSKNSETSAMIDSFLSGESESTAEQLVATILAEYEGRQKLLNRQCGEDLSCQPSGLWIAGRVQIPHHVQSAATEHATAGADSDVATDDALALWTKRICSAAQALSAAGLSKALVLGKLVSGNNPMNLLIKNKMQNKTN